MECSELSIHCKAEAEVDPAFLIKGGDLIQKSSFQILENYSK